jgi:hypothetical protein
MRKTKALLLFCLAMAFVTVAYASSKISDDGYRLLRELVSYKNREIDMLKNLNQYTLDCNNVSDAQFAAKKCSDRMAEMQSQDRDLQVKHDVFGHDLQAHLRQHKDEESLFMGLMLDDREFSNFAH